MNINTNPITFFRGHLGRIYSD